MEIDLNKICEIYGKELLKSIKYNIKEVTNNVNYLTSKNLENVKEIFERNCLVFLQEENIFREKIDYLYKKYGQNLDNNIELWEEIQ